jgi:hypothetical protein
MTALHTIPLTPEPPAARLARLQAESLALALELADKAIADAVAASEALSEAGGFLALPGGLRDRLQRLGAKLKAETDSVLAVRGRLGR